jgi:glutamate formiminotransferase/formiminotetrahydrofolate cyclodeaminase
VAKLTYGVRKFENLDAKMREIIPPLHRISQELIPLIDADTDAFADYMAALRMPNETEDDNRQRQEAMQAGLKAAIQIPLATMRLGDEAWEAMVATATHGNPASKSDVQVGARSLEAGIWGAWQNVLINMKAVTEEDFKAEVLKEAEGIAQRAKDSCAKVLTILDKRILPSKSKSKSKSASASE